ncbi:HAD family hydrolase [Paenibacillus sambharensis]|uniref:HAD family hydrolase n=1 Tax=Paenibacillus sambharensis TaxID=1803190 RepID=A0A2W1LHK3_9BACL|nr:HAD family hydrolase [Paenibacillus sambharensis]PZD94435.1 HAD family hydrolase [Paenibacillus sambharensis]
MKLLISDLDGTIIHNHSTINQEDIDALHQAAEAGVQIAFASGRMQPEIEAVMQQLNLRVHTISQNGAYVHMSDGELVSEQAFDRDKLVALAKAGEGTPFLTMMCGPDHYFVEEMTAHAEEIGSRLMAPLHVIPDARSRLGKDIVSGKISFFGEVEKLRAFMQSLKAEHGDAIDAYISDIDCMDVMPAGVSKGTGVKVLQERLKISPEETVCIGDSFNDISMFAGTPHSYAMTASHADVKAAAAHEAESVAAIIRRLLHS